MFRDTLCLLHAIYEPFKAFLRLFVDAGKISVELTAGQKCCVGCFERLIEGMKQAQGITERLKEENALEWTGRLNNIRACAMEIVGKEIIYV